MEQEEQVASKQLVDIKPIAWEADSFEMHRRSWSWYVLVLLALLAAIAYSIYTHNWLLLGLAVMIGVTLYLSNRMSPDKVQCEINNQGIRVGARMFGYDQLKNFWISREGGRIKLNLIVTLRFMPVISLAITSELEGSVRSALVNRVPESANQREDWVDRINRFLKI